MPRRDTGFAVPSGDALAADFEADYNGRLQGQDARVRGTNAYALAQVVGRMAQLAYQALPHYLRAIFPDLAPDHVLDRHAAIQGLRRSPATRATGQVTFTGADGVTIPKGTRVTWKLGNRGIEYATTEAGGLGASTPGQRTLPVEATTFGADANGPAVGDPMPLVAPITAVDSEATVDAAISGGTDQESNASLRRRILQALRRAVQGGAKADYERWALATPDVAVTRVWVRDAEDQQETSPVNRLGGHVAVFFLVDGTGAGVQPTSSQVSAVQSSIDARDRRPAHVRSTVRQVVLNELEIDVALEGGATGSTVQDAVEAELVAEVNRRRAPGAELENSQLRAAISRAAGEVAHDVDAIRAIDRNGNVSSLPVLVDPLPDGGDAIFYTTPSRISFV